MLQGYSACTFNALIAQKEPTLTIMITTVLRLKSCPTSVFLKKKLHNL